jgi:3-methyladenine DNA glycosylase/8-oxoguanine DNA glycosylase
MNRPVLEVADLVRAAGDAFIERSSLPAIVTRVRRVFDVGANIETIDAHLSRDPLLAPLVARRPGLRAPGGWDGFELAVRAILGQQISVAAARRLAGELVAVHGEAVSKGGVSHARLSHVFPSAERLAAAESIDLRMPRVVEGVGGSRGAGSEPVRSSKMVAVNLQLPALLPPCRARTGKDISCRAIGVQA